MNQMRAQELTTALLTPLFLGMAPIFGKLAIHAGADPFTVAATRTTVAVVLLWVVYLIFFRRYIYIYPAGLLGCIMIGFLNGIGSLFYYSGLNLLDASLAQLLNGMYLVFAVMLSHIGGEKVDRRTVIRVILALTALVIITGLGKETVNWLGVGLMLANALMFAGTVILSQYVLYEMPSPTVTLYILSTMGVVVVMAWVATGQHTALATIQPALAPIFVLGITTALSRLAMFSGIKFFGSLQTAMLAMTEIAVALTLAFFILGDRLSGAQWVGVCLLAASLLLIRGSDLRRSGVNPNALLVSNLAGLQFQRIAFHRAFGTKEQDNEEEVMSSVTTTELRAIQRMMGVDTGPLNPLPITRPDESVQDDQVAALLNSTKLPTSHPDSD